MRTLPGLAAVYRRKSTLMLDAFDRCFDSRVTRTERTAACLFGVPCLRAVIPSRLPRPPPKPVCWLCPEPDS